MQCNAGECNAGDPGLIPGSGRSPGEGNGNPTPVFLPREFHGQGSLADYTVHGVTKSRHDWATSTSFTFSEKKKETTRNWYIPWKEKWSFIPAYHMWCHTVITILTEELLVGNGATEMLRVFRTLRTASLFPQVVTYTLIELKVQASLIYMVWPDQIDSSTVSLWSNLDLRRWKKTYPRD